MPRGEIVNSSVKDLIFFKNDAKEENVKKSNIYREAVDLHKKIIDNTELARYYVNSSSRLDDTCKAQCYSLLTTIEWLAQSNLSNTRTGFYNRFLLTTKQKEDTQNRTTNALASLDDDLSWTEQILDILKNDRKKIGAIKSWLPQIKDTRLVPQNLEEAKQIKETAQATFRLKQAFNESHKESRELIGEITHSRQRIKEKGLVKQNQEEAEKIRQVALKLEQAHKLDTYAHLSFILHEKPSLMKPAWHSILDTIMDEPVASWLTSEELRESMCIQQAARLILLGNAPKGKPVKEIVNRVGQLLEANNNYIFMKVEKFKEELREKLPKHIDTLEEEVQEAKDFFRETEASLEQIGQIHPALKTQLRKQLTSVLENLPKESVLNPSILENLRQSYLNDTETHPWVQHLELFKKYREKIFRAMDDIAHYQTEPLMFRDCRVASVRDFKELADNLHCALEPGKSPEQVYRVLYFLLRERLAIKKLANAFQKQDKNGRTLEAALTQRFGEGIPQLQYALHLIRKEDASTDQTINRRPEYRDEYMTLSRRMHDALSGKDLETVYRILTPLQRNTESLCRFNAWYKYYKGSLNPDLQADIPGLQADMKQYLEGDSLKFGLFLIGDRAMETGVVSLSEAERLSKMALQQTFERKDGVRVPVPYEAAYSYGSQCLFRAHILAESLTELGYSMEKIFFQFLRTDKDGRKVCGLVYDDGLAWNHVACCMRVRTDSGNEEIRILDSAGVAPGNLDKPTLWTIEKWAKMLVDADPYEFIDFKKFQELLKKEQQKYPNPVNYSDPFPAGRPYFFTTDRIYVGVPTLDRIELSRLTDLPNQYSNVIYYKYGLEGTTKSTEWVPFCRVKDAISEEIQKLTINDDESAKDFLNAIIKKFEAGIEEFHLGRSLSSFSSHFPNSYKSFITYLEGRVSPATLALFKEHLSEPLLPAFESAQA